jgi:hypothetical protein
VLETWWDIFFHFSEITNIWLHQNVVLLVSHCKEKCISSCMQRTISTYSTANADPVFSAFPRREVNMFRITSPRLFIAGLGGAKFLPQRDNLPVVGTSLFW